jgi:hypothetical protein
MGELDEEKEGEKFIADILETKKSEDQVAAKEYEKTQIDRITGHDQEDVRVKRVPFFIERDAQGISPNAADQPDRGQNERGCDYFETCGLS